VLRIRGEFKNYSFFCTCPVSVIKNVGHAYAHMHARIHTHKEFFFLLMQNCVWQSGAVIRCYGVIDVCRFCV
jgi:hypothetical protein